ncbi:MAG: hypothetical protein H6708_29775 [Kofleriaceae bacterium]|nr:hypothetical protein [Myxococcales bacterium]MCB9564594.1 hypothetical protein [Kofleriaceae bacterium]
MTSVRRFAFASSALFTLATAACGGGDDTPATPDADTGGNPGFILPTDTTKANMDDAPIGEADWSCLNTASDDVATAVEIHLTGVINDFQDNSKEIRDGTITVFPDTDYMNPVDTSGPTAVDGVFDLTLTTGVKRFGFKVSAPNYMDTFLLNQAFDANTVDQSQNVSAISTGLATALPAFIGITRTVGDGVLAGAMRDCAGNEVSNAIATVSSTSGTADHLDGAQTFYLDAGTSLPVKHDTLSSTDANGLFAVFELPVTTQAYVQVWGFVNQADIAQGEAGLTLLAELPSPVVADTIITGSIEPLRN